MNYTNCAECKEKLIIEESHYIQDGKCWFCDNSDCELFRNYSFHFDCENNLKIYYIILVVDKIKYFINSFCRTTIIYLSDWNGDIVCQLPSRLT